MTRETSLNNPGGLEHSSDKWQGQSHLQDDPRFVRFDSPTWGIRALMKDLLAYQEKHDLNSVAEIISRWAPPNENNTDAYIADVAQRMDVQADTPLDLSNAATLIKLAQAIVHHENGRPPPGVPDFWYDAGTYQEAARLALS